MLAVIGAILAIGLLIVVHEAGHYVVARRCKMRVDRFSIGFGPPILKWKRGETDFTLGPIPFGGFVQIHGMTLAEEVAPDDTRCYPNRPVWQRFLTIFAGPATNYLSAIVLAMALYTCHGIDVPHWYGVGKAMPEYDAYGKLEPGDRITKVNGVPLFVDSGSSLTERINDSKGSPVALTVERDGRTLEVSVKPKQEKDSAGKTVWRIGVAYEKQELVVGVGVLDAAQRALVYPVEQTKAIGKALYGIVFGSEKADPGGPIRMVEEFYRAFSAGIDPGINLLMMLSVYLGLFNLLPIPALDGGRLVFLVYEMVTRRRANPKIETMVHMAGIMALGVVMLVVLYIDLRRFWT